ncbi:MAG: hypothetical protein PHP25_03440, partial [Candidatus Moranbacteria bacterium]|nr:hypothetical protein [Candidatus Moranbacteria bacterium]
SLVLVRKEFADPSSKLLKNWLTMAGRNTRGTVMRKQGREMSQNTLSVNCLFSKCYLFSWAVGCTAGQTTYCSLANFIKEYILHPKNCAGSACQSLNIEKGCLAHQTTHCSRAQQLLGA